MTNINNIKINEIKKFFQDCERNGIDCSIFSQQKSKEPFYNIPFPRDIEVKQNLTREDLKSLKFNEDILEISRNIEFYNIRKNPMGISGDVNVGSNKIQLLIPFSKKDRNIFLKKYESKETILCNVNITYNLHTEEFYVTSMKIYSHEKAFEEWKNIMMNKTLKERVEKLLEILGLNPDTLLYHEKVIQVTRLIPLVVKKFLYLEISKKELGKTYSYSSLGFNPNTLLLTRANMFIDGRSGKNGDFFAENTAFIIDEINKVNDPDVITSLQVYMNGKKDVGEIIINGKEKKKTDISTIILGNAKDKFDFTNLFVNKINLFSNTVIMNSSDGEAFISRINALANSWGCRPFSKNFIKKGISNFYELTLLKEVISELRSKKIEIPEKVSSFLDRNFKIRGTVSVEKNLEGWIKLLYPEYIDKINSIPEIEFQFMLERSMEARLTIENQLHIINPNDNEKLNIPLNPLLKNLIVAMPGSIMYTPHRIFINHENALVEKIPLDAIGIEMNEKEFSFLNKHQQECLYQQYLYQQKCLYEQYLNQQQYLYQQYLYQQYCFQQEYLYQQYLNQQRLVVNSFDGVNLKHTIFNNDICWSSFRNDYNYLCGENEYPQIVD
ncbi:MAG: hypothetical protein KGV57_02620 [Fusobacterium sp.]|nr:hypothetical protein [Fusobacterium sp.]